MEKKDRPEADVWAWFAARFQQAQPGASEKDRRVGLRNRHREAKTARVRSTTELRETYAPRTFKFLAWWMASVGAIVLLQGFGGFLWLKFKLSDVVLSTIVGGTAVAVVGLAHAVVKGLFGHRDN